MMLASSMLMVFVVVNPSASNATGTPPNITEDDIIQPIEYQPGLGNAPFSLLGGSVNDPLGLIPYPGETQRYSLGHDVFEVWECPSSGTVPMTAAQFVSEAETRMTAYFSWQSEGRYDPDFIVGGKVPNGVTNCGEWLTDRNFDRSTGKAAGALFIRSGAGGFAGPGFMCPGSSSSCPTTFPRNQRIGYVGVSGSAIWTTVAHEMGHMLSWPHSKTGASGSSYDNAIDVMSGNYNSWKVGSGTRWGTYIEPYATAAINRYGAGWFDPNDVTVWNRTSTTVTLDAIGSGKNQLLIVEQADSFFALGARVSSASDPFSSAWTGVEVYEIGRCSGCWGINRSVTPEPGVPFVVNDLDSYGVPLPHVLTVGSSMILGDASVSVIGRSGNTFTLAIVSTSSGPSTRFIDVPSTHTFYSDIEWLAEAGTTKGCNPPVNSLYCPDGAVTRGQMAAFLSRALNLKPAGKDFFIDDEASIFEDDINRLAAAGVTKGCNPPANDRFCSESKLTRGQMAAFLVRALNFTDNGGGDLFIDDDTSLFESDIDRLGTAGVTKGCNPPTNNRYCPNSYVTRAQMAAFLHRALS
jgi:hypothetical protein